MSKNSKIYIFIIAAAFFSFGCSSAKNAPNTTQKSEIVMDDGYKTTDKNELLIEDKDLPSLHEAVVTSKENSQQENVVAYDGSKISVMLDGYGNKSETRYFDNDPRLQMVLVRTSASGQRQVFVYGQNGEVKDLPQNMIGKALTSTSAELAKAAGINEIRKEQVVSQNFQGVTTQTMTASIQSQPVNQTQTQTQPIESAKTQTEARGETIAKQVEPTDKPDSTEKTEAPTKLSENLQNFIPKKRRDAITDN